MIVSEWERLRERELQDYGRERKGWRVVGMRGGGRDRELNLVQYFVVLIL